jgi:glycerol kinase
MNATHVILIFDIGKTNKKLLLFDEAYNMVYESIEQFQEIKDEDGFDGEDIIKLKDWHLNILRNQLIKVT